METHVLHVGQTAFSISTYVIKPTNVHVYSMLYHILFITLPLMH